MQFQICGLLRKLKDFLSAFTVGNRRTGNERTRLVLPVVKTTLILTLVTIVIKALYLQIKLSPVATIGNPSLHVRLGIMFGLNNCSALADGFAGN